ncbi:predicted protein [Streptomyces viridosporus ATCC 14672]|uniref:Predicted protein n=1 Tax=Streptomyces viridosporus (strain ATCC 14672 / DSM 40746 / JCM 4963 / KCTC 9882 / NRRL B-12104 / FH 1290) TaxID=566461 RepID=D5ZTQ6_STRV1|nr:predicted protein [Streptomyces viridosporus ATCC 14672]
MRTAADPDKLDLVRRRTSTPSAGVGARSAATAPRAGVTFRGGRPSGGRGALQRGAPAVRKG